MNDFDSIIKRMTVTHVGPEDYTGEDGLLYEAVSHGCIAAGGALTSLPLPV